MQSLYRYSMQQGPPQSTPWCGIPVCCMVGGDIALQSSRALHQSLPPITRTLRAANAAAVRPLSESSVSSNSSVSGWGRPAPPLRVGGRAPPSSTSLSCWYISNLPAAMRSRHALSDASAVPSCWASMRTTLLASSGGSGCCCHCSGARISIVVNGIGCVST